AERQQDLKRARSRPDDVRVSHAALLVHGFSHLGADDVPDRAVVAWGSSRRAARAAPTNTSHAPEGAVMTSPAPVIVPSEVLHERLERVDADAVVVNLFRGVRIPGGATGALDDALGGAIRELIEGGDLKGELGEVAVLYPRGAVAARRVLVVGLGPSDGFGLEQVRRASAAAASKAREVGAARVATIVHGAGVGGLDVAEAAQATLEGALLAGYRFASAKKGAADAPRLEHVAVVEADAGRLDAVRQGVRAAQAVARGVVRARDLVNRPPNVANPAHLAPTARDL